MHSIIISLVKHSMENSRIFHQQKVMRISSILSVIIPFAFCTDSLPDTLTGEEFAFETQVNKVMDIIIHSLYKTKDVFVRELISNSADALDKVRLASLTDESVLKGNPDLKIMIKTSKV